MLFLFTLLSCFFVRAFVTTTSSCALLLSLHSTAVIAVSTPDLTTLTTLTPQHGLILLTNTLAVFYLALIVFLIYLFGLQVHAFTRTYAPAQPITTLVQLETA
jgi:hypothetical protein